MVVAEVIGREVYADRAVRFPYRGMCDGAVRPAGGGTRDNLALVGSRVERGVVLKELGTLRTPTWTPRSTLPTRAALNFPHWSSVDSVAMSSARAAVTLASCWRFASSDRS